MERPKTMTSLQMAFAKMTLTMTNAIMTALIAVLHPVIWTIALNVIAKVVFLTISFNPKGCGGGDPKVTTGREIVCHFSQSRAMVTKNLDFIHMHPN